MGHIFSRALRRITQCTNQSRNQHQEQQERNQTSTADRSEQSQQLATKTVIAQSIPVGQSIDSADFNALETNRTVNQSQQEPASTTEAKPTQPFKDTTIDETNKQDVEEAVIKIQAFVRGHLTRKALKDAQHHSLPAPNALGQSQFDEDSLTRNPPSAVFLSSSPLNFNEANLHQPLGGPLSSTGNRSPLESIAELTETTTFTSLHQPALENDPIAQLNSSNDSRNRNDSDQKRKLSPLNTRSASSPSKIEIPLSPQRQDSLSRSPVPSEANVSIDLCCETPASASIDILDHNIKPIDRMASVLHHKASTKQESLEKPLSTNQEKLVTAYMEQDRGDEEHSSKPLIEKSKTPDSFESEEAAAIRIQSAFRGYRTRKNSPYRTRSPNSANSQAKKSVLLRQQQANVLHESDDVDEAIGKKEQSPEDNEKRGLLLESVEQVEASERALAEGRRLSRPRQREPSPTIQAAQSVEEFNSIEDTVREVAGKSESITTADVEEPIQQSNVIGDAVKEQRQSVDVTGNSLSEPGADDTFSAALETESRTTNNDASAILEVRESSGKESDASVESDSSALGAALSLNESEEATSELHPQQSVASAPPMLDPIDEMDKSVGFSLTEELESEAKRLVDELESVEQKQETEASKENPTASQADDLALEEATNRLESALEAATDGIESLLLDEDEQRAIELESDDIEKRNPLGHVSGARQSMSPPIESSESKLSHQIEDGGRLVQEKEDENTNVEALTVEMSKSGEVSGLSSPALASSNNSSDEDNSDQEEKNQSHHHQQQQQQSSKFGAGKKRRNRNKKKNKK